MVISNSYASITMSMSYQVVHWNVERNERPIKTKAVSMRQGIKNKTYKCT